MYEPLAVSVEEACSMIGVGRTTAFALLKEGSLDRCKIRSRTVVTVESIKRLIGNARGDEL